MKKSKNKKNYQLLKPHINTSHSKREGLLSSMSTAIVIDAENKSFGRVCSEVAKILLGKNNIYYAHNKFNGMAVKIKNYDKAVLTGNKHNDLMTFWYTGFPGGIKSAKVSEQIANNHEQMYKKSIKNMLPKNKIFEKAVKHCIFFELA